MLIVYFAIYNQFKLMQRSERRVKASLLVAFRHI